jgi:tRNA(Ile)-lysidine synthase TilS/MesJ
MIHNPVSFARRHVLGDLYSRCDTLTGELPVYLGGDVPELLGHVDEGLGSYRDAFSFHLADDVCKRLSAGHYTYSFSYSHTEADAKGSRGRITLNSITLMTRKGYDKPVPKRPREAKAAALEAAAAAATVEV